MKKTAICLILAAILSYSACGNIESDNGGNDSSIESTQTEVVTSDPSDDELPEDLNFGGETVTFLYRSEISVRISTAMDNPTTLICSASESTIRTI